MSDTPAPEKHEFKAEVAAVLKLVTHSLYTNREIFLRELISNASDAIDKARYTALVDTSLEGQELEPSVRLSADAERGVLIVEDNGIGMTPDEARANLGTIAHSGTLACFSLSPCCRMCSFTSLTGDLQGRHGLRFHWGRARRACRGVGVHHTQS